MKAVIMAGGTGNRFWPQSVESKPKQFLSLFSDRSMIWETYHRLAEWLPKDNIYMITTNQYVDLVKEYVPEIDPSRILVEPDRRDTGPCIALMALHFINCKDDEVLVTLPADHNIPDWEALRSSLLKAEKKARELGAIVTLGVIPTRAETSYGYMEIDHAFVSDQVYPVKRFIEKPQPDQAEELLQNPNVYWNSGIVIWRPSTIAHYMDNYCPDIWKPLSQNYWNVKEIYSELPKVSVDYAILEKVNNISMIPVSFQWDDVGIWTALERYLEKDDHGNIVKGEVTAMESEDNIIWSDKKTIVIGAIDLIIVSTDYGVLVCSKSKEHYIKMALQSINETVKN